MTKLGGNLVAVLQKRGGCNHENEMRPESLPGGCQVTVHETALDVEEDTFKCLMRGVNEELGEAVGRMVQERAESNFSRLKTLYFIETSEKVVLTFGIELAPGFFKSVRLNASTGGLVPITEHELIFLKNLTEFDRHVGVLCRTDIAMFPDEIESVKKAFEIFGTDGLSTN